MHVHARPSGQRASGPVRWRARGSRGTLGRDVSQLSRVVGLREDRRLLRAHRRVEPQDVGGAAAVRLGDAAVRVVRRHREVRRHGHVREPPGHRVVDAAARRGVLARGREERVRGRLGLARVGRVGEPGAPEERPVDEAAAPGAVALEKGVERVANSSSWRDELAGGAASGGRSGGGTAADDAKWAATAASGLNPSKSTTITCTRRKRRKRRRKRRKRRKSRKKSRKRSQ